MAHRTYRAYQPWRTSLGSQCGALLCEVQSLKRRPFTKPIHHERTVDTTMIITNKHGLPEPLVRAVALDDYSKGDADFSVTELIKPPRIAALEQLYKGVLEEDASDRLWALMGKAGHEVLRRSSKDGIVEETVTVEFQGVKIKGQMDYAVVMKALWDYKFVSLWAIKDGVKPEWDQQLNIYKWMAEQYGVEVKELTIIGIL